jgi:probable HAF family extracellular repeat protein
VGAFTDSGGWHGFLRDPQGGYTQLDVPCAMATQPHGINNLGEIVGIWGDSARNVHGFYRDNQGAYYRIDNPDAMIPPPNVPTLVTGPFRISNNGQIVGTFRGRDDIYHGFKTQLPGAPPLTLCGN